MRNLVYELQPSEQQSTRASLTVRLRREFPATETTFERVACSCLDPVGQPIRWQVGVSQLASGLAPGIDGR